MNRTEILREILKTEYGINSMEELDRAIKKQRKLDITVFCLDIGKKRGE